MPASDADLFEIDLLLCKTAFPPSVARRFSGFVSYIAQHYGIHGGMAAAKALAIALQDREEDDEPTSTGSDQLSEELIEKVSAMCLQHGTSGALRFFIRIPLLTRVRTSIHRSSYMHFVSCCDREQVSCNDAIYVGASYLGVAGLLPPLPLYTTRLEADVVAESPTSSSEGSEEKRRHTRIEGSSVR